MYMVLLLVPLLLVTWIILIQALLHYNYISRHYWDFFSWKCNENLWNTHEKFKFHGVVPMKMNIINENSMKPQWKNDMKMPWNKSHAMKTLWNNIFHGFSWYFHWERFNFMGTTCIFHGYFITFSWANRTCQLYLHTY